MTIHPVRPRAFRLCSSKPGSARSLAGMRMSTPSSRIMKARRARSKTHTTTNVFRTLSGGTRGNNEQRCELRGEGRNHAREKIQRRRAQAAPRQRKSPAKIAFWSAVSPADIRTHKRTDGGERIATARTNQARPEAQQPRRPGPRRAPAIPPCDLMCSKRRAGVCGAFRHLHPCPAPKGGSPALWRAMGGRNAWTSERASETSTAWTTGGRECRERTGGEACVSSIMDRCPCSPFAVQMARPARPYRPYFRTQDPAAAPKGRHARPRRARAILCVLSRFSLLPLTVLVRHLERLVRHRRGQRAAGHARRRVPALRVGPRVHRVDALRAGAARGAREVVLENLAAGLYTCAMKKSGAASVMRQQRRWRDGCVRPCPCALQRISSPQRSAAQQRTCASAARRGTP